MLDKFVVAVASGKGGTAGKGRTKTQLPKLRIMKTRLTRREKRK